MKKRRLLAVVCCLWASSFFGISLDFIDTKFDDFMARIAIPSDQRADFKSYYLGVYLKLQEADESKKTAAYGYLYKKALASLKDKHPDWHASIRPFVTDPLLALDTRINELRTCIGGFLLRYGAYEEYCSKKRGTDQTPTLEAINNDDGIWHKMRWYAAGAQKKIMCWCGKIKQPLS